VVQRSGRHAAGIPQHLSPPGLPIVESRKAGSQLSLRVPRMDHDLEASSSPPPYGDDGFTASTVTVLSSPVPVEEAFGLVFVRPKAKKAVNAERWLCGEERRSATSASASTTPSTSGTRSAVQLEAVLDTFLECYHVFALHADTVAKYFLVRPSAFEPFGPHLRFHSLQKSLLDMKGTDPRLGTAPARTVEYLISRHGALPQRRSPSPVPLPPLAAERTAVEQPSTRPAP